MLKGFLKPRLARLGKIRLGERAISKNSGKEYPSDLPTFRVPEEVAAIYGDDPTELDVMVPSADFDAFCPIELQRWGADERKLCCSKDGETALRWNDEIGGLEEIPCAYQDCPYYGKAKGQGCDERGNLFLILPKVSLGGVYQVDTGSRTGLNNLNNEFVTFQTILNNLTGNGDMVRAVIFKLTRELETLHYIDNGVRKPVQKYILHLRAPNLSMEKAQQLAAQFRGNAGTPLLSSGEAIALPAMTSDDERVLPELPPAAELPEAVDECPKDLVPGASPVGPDLGQKSAWAALLEQVAALGKSVTTAEKSVCQAVSKGEADRFEDLAGADEAGAALEMLAGMVQKWQGEGQTKPEAAAAKKTQPQARKATAPPANMSF